MLKDKEDAEKEYQRLRKEKKFIQSLMLMIREYDLTNDPKKVTQMYASNTEKARVGIVWSAGDKEAKKVIYEFFSVQNVVKRLRIL